MNIYDEAINSMLNEEEGYQIKIEKLLNRAKLEHELLGLQRTWIDTTYNPYTRGKLWVKITKLEKELEELK